MTFLLFLCTPANVNLDITKESSRHFEVVENLRRWCLQMKRMFTRIFYFRLSIYVGHACSKGLVFILPRLKKKANFNFHRANFQFTSSFYTAQTYFFFYLVVNEEIFYSKWWWFFFNWYFLHYH